MVISENFVAIPREEYSELCKLKGKVDSVQDIMNSKESVYIEDICMIIGIDMYIYNQIQDQ